MPDDFTPILRWTTLRKHPLSEAEQAKMRLIVEEMKRLCLGSGRAHCDLLDPSTGGALNQCRHNVELPSFFNTRLGLAHSPDRAATLTIQIDKERKNTGPFEILMDFSPKFETDK